jgi:hypothetical protein
MSETLGGVRALGRALRLRMRMDKGIPVEIQMALLRLAACDLEVCVKRSSLIANSETREHADGSSEPTRKACVAA